MATSFGYKFGKSLGGLLICFYLLAAIMGIGGSILAIEALTGLQAWYYYLGGAVIGLLVLWFIPRPVDILLLSPLAVYGGVHKLGLTWTMAAIIMAVPVILVVLMSLGRK